MSEINIGGRKIDLRRRLLAACGHYSGVTAGLDTDRILIMQPEARERLLLVHRLVCDLLNDDAAQMNRHLRLSSRLELELAVLRGTVLSIFLEKEIVVSRLESGISPDFIGSTPTNISILLDSAGEAVGKGYTAYMHAVWDNPALRLIPPVDVVVNFLYAAEDATALGAAAAAAFIYHSRLLGSGVSAEKLRHEQLALVSAFADSDVLTFREDHIFASKH